MMGRLEAGQERLFYHFRLEDQVPANHLLRKLDALLDFDMVRKQLEPFYSVIGRPGGALDAVLQARAEGLVRFIGVTGHGWTVAAMHRRSLERFDFDSVLMPWNWFCAHHPTYAADFEATVALCEQRNVAVQTIKALARGPWAAGTARNRETWYQPLEDAADIRAAVHWVLARPRLFLNSVGDVNLLPLVLQAADEVGPVPDDAAMAKLNERTGLSSIFGL